MHKTAFFSIRQSIRNFSTDPKFRPTLQNLCMKTCDFCVSKLIHLEKKPYPLSSPTFVNDFGCASVIFFSWIENYLWKSLRKVEKPDDSAIR